MPSRPPFLLARALEPVMACLWVLFVLWTLIVAGIWLSGFGEAELRDSVANQGLRNALALCLEVLDLTWITLAAANCYVALASAEGLATARRWALMIIASAALIAASSAAFGFPFGPIAYTAGLGPRIGPIPLGEPLCWFVFVVGSRFLVLYLLPRISHALAALATGLLVMLADAIFEPLAWHVRALWIWYPGIAPAPCTPPTQNYATWFIGATALAFVMRESRVAVTTARPFPRPASVFLMLVAVFLATHAMRLFGGLIQRGQFPANI
jgi:putative membrane protein